MPGEQAPFELTQPGAHDGVGEQKPPEHVVPHGQDVHTEPLMPQAEVEVPGWQTPFRQQPGQELAPQVVDWQKPLTQLEPDEHAEQTMPLMPQARSATPRWQTPFRQQPAQVDGPQAGGAQRPLEQTPLEHCPHA